MSGKSSTAKKKKDQANLEADSQAQDQTQTDAQEQSATEPETVEATQEVSEPQEGSNTNANEPEPTPNTAPDSASDSVNEPVPLNALTLEDLYHELLDLRHLVTEHSSAIIELQQTTARKRKPVASNGKVQLCDKKTGTVYPSKNNAYQSLLKAGELKELIDKGLLGTEPSKNTFGIYVLLREWPDRFEEVQEAQNNK
ncbi:MAG: hypothetical protein JW712_04575 [Dehalococcoidales bacterium]|nr:hypothetical protein [Dehalococcoidales bacterium]